ncbi:MAG TPA: DUF2199 domain-containing protein [Polyangiaceae bacterium]
MGYRCATCKTIHEDLPDVGFAKPDYVFGVPMAERDARVIWTPDTCIVDRERYFVRGVLELPFVDDPNRGTFGFGVWVSQKKESFDRYVSAKEGEAIGPFFGWLCTAITSFPRPEDRLKTMAHFSKEGRQRPRIELEPTEHPLAVAQREGITIARAWEIVHHHLPPN